MPSTVILLISLLITCCYCQTCPYMSGPCSCMPSMYAPISIKCTGADSIRTVLDSLSPVKPLRVDSLRITSTDLGTLRNFTFDGFNIVELILDTCRLVDIESQAFEPTLTSTLTSLNLNNNKLARIPADAVSRLGTLSSFQMGRNDLKNISGSPFVGFRSARTLSKLVLADNALDTCPPSTFLGLSSLRDLDLSNNRLDENSLKSLKSSLTQSRSTLTNLDLSDNKISFIQTGDLDYPNLETLTLSGNGIQPYSLNADTFKGTPRLSHLYLSGNPLMSWNPDLFRFVPNLSTLDVSGTSISTIPPDAFQYTPNLSVLMMSNAGVENIGSGALSAIPNVVKISLDNNRIKSIRRDMFGGLTKLKFLFLPRNYLTSVDDWSWSSLPSLSQLDLSDNNLTTLPSNAFANTFLSSSSDQRFLYLCKNPWNCDTKLDWLRSWLRTECNIGIDVVATKCYSLCRTPTELERVPLMGDTPMTPDPSVDGGSSTGSSLGGGTDTFSNSTSEYQIQMETATVGYIILGIILVVLLITIILLALARYFVSRKHKQDKDDQKSLAPVGASSRSTVYPSSIISTGYPISAFDMDSPRAYPPSSRYGY